jgi:hypothetical protein
MNQGQEFSRKKSLGQTLCAIPELFAVRKGVTSIWYRLRLLLFRATSYQKPNLVAVAHLIEITPNLWPGTIVWQGLACFKRPDREPRR